jgi:hypothetical protein
MLARFSTCTTGIQTRRDPSHGLAEQPRSLCRLACRRLSGDQPDPKEWGVSTSGNESEARYRRLRQVWQLRIPELESVITRTGLDGKRGAWRRIYHAHVSSEVYQWFVPFCLPCSLRFP